MGPSLVERPERHGNPRRLSCHPERPGRGYRMIRRCRAAFRKVEGDPRTQYVLHKVMARFWLVNFAAATAVYLFAPKIWASVSILYIVWISLYANWSTDAGAMSAADAATTEAITAFATEKAEEPG